MPDGLDVGILHRRATLVLYLSWLRVRTGQSRSYRNDLADMGERRPGPSCRYARKFVEQAIPFKLRSDQDFGQLRQDSLLRRAERSPIRLAGGGEAFGRRGHGFDSTRNKMGVCAKRGDASAIGMVE